MFHFQYQYVTFGICLEYLFPDSQQLLQRIGKVHTESIKTKIFTEQPSQTQSSYPARKQQVLTRHASQWNLLTVQGFFCGPVRKNSCLLDAECSKFLPLDKRLELCKLQFIVHVFSHDAFNFNHACPILHMHKNINRAHNLKFYSVSGKCRRVNMLHYLNGYHKTRSQTRWVISLLQFPDVMLTAFQNSRNSERRQWLVRKFGKQPLLDIPELLHP